MLFVPLATDDLMERWPIANWAIIGLNILVFVFATSPIDTEAEAVAVLDNFALRPMHFSPFTLLSYQFLHADFFHLFGNMIFLFAFGNSVNARFGHLKYTIGYLSLGMLSGLAHVAADPASIVPTIGASGAVCGITAMFIIWFPKARIQMWYWVFVRMGIFWIGSAWAIGAWFVLDVLGAFNITPGGGVAYVAHLGGYAAGALLAYATLKMGVVKPKTVAAYEAPPLPAADQTPSPLRVGQDHSTTLTAAIATNDTQGLLAAYRDYLTNQSMPLSSLATEKTALKKTLDAGEDDLALMGLLRLIHFHDDAPDAAEWRYSAARICAGQPTERAKALRLLKEVVSLYPGSDYAEKAREDLARLQA